MKYLYIEFENKELWRIPAEIIAKNRAHYYALKENVEDNENTFKEEFEYVMSEDGQDEIADWAFNNMNWIDFYPFAEQVHKEKEKDYQQMWLNGIDDCYIKED